MARRATFIEQARADAEHLLLLDAGDSIWSDRRFTVDSQWQLAVAMMNALGYDAATLGSKDLQLGADVLRQRLDEATFPILSANVIVSATGELLAVPYTLRDLGGHQVAILGLTDVPPDPGLSSGLQVADPVDTAHQYVPELARQADIVIVLSHAGAAADTQVAAELPEIDLVVGGIYSQPAARPALSAGTSPLLVAERPMAGHAGRFVGQADLVFDSAGRLQDLSWRTVKLGPEWADDPALSALVASYANRPAVAPLSGQ